MVLRVARGLADPDSKPGELLVAHLADDRAQAVVRAGTALVAQPDPAQRQVEVVDHDEHVLERRTLAREHLAHRDARKVHVRGRLDEHQVEAVVLAVDRRRGVARAGMAGPAGALGQPVEHHPAHVVARFLVLPARISEADDDLHLTQLTLRQTRLPAGLDDRPLNADATAHASSLALALAMTVVAGCTADPVPTEAVVPPNPWGPFAVSMDGNGMKALTGGTLGFTETCTFVERDGERRLLIWSAAQTCWDSPSGTTVFRGEKGRFIDQRPANGCRSAAGASAPRRWAGRSRTSWPGSTGSNGPIQNA